ncbi:MAG: NAD(P)-dependent oxidoreductase [Actinobacteria bacterium]|nr:NAD(P)-dependent oxidoreductase [Actinomycetota bacterium]
MERIGFIGTGVMGLPMAGHLLDAGYPLGVFNRTPERAAPLLERGAVWHDDPASVASASDVVVTIVGFPADVEEVYLGGGGVLAHAAEGALAIDMTTSSPLLARRIAEAGEERGVAVLDAPVSGGDTGARNGTLAIMVGGDEDAFGRALPLFEAMGSNITRLGGPGAGQYTKMCNQIAIASGMVGVCESMHYARAAGLDPARVVETIEKGAAGSWSLSNLMPRAIAGDFAPGFKIKHFVKDLRIALDSAVEMGLDLPGLTMAHALYAALEAAGEGEDGTQALLRRYEQE